MTIQINGQLARDERGTVAVIFSFIAAGLIIAGGLAIDTGRTLGTASKMTAILDAVSLAASKVMSESELSEADAIVFARAELGRQLQAAHLSSAPVREPVITVDPATGSVEVGLEFAVPTTFGRIAGVDAIQLYRVSTAVQNIRRVDLALVLDVTGSMNSNGKLSQLKDAAVELVDILMPQNKPLLNRIALAPYSAAVNLGPDIAASASNSASTDGCVVERDGDNASTEAPPADGSYFTVESQLTIPPADNHYACPPATLLPLTNNAGLLRGTINSYGADGWTAGHIGLAWGWYGMERRLARRQRRPAIRPGPHRQGGHFDD